MKAEWEKLAWIALAIVLLATACGPSAAELPPTPAPTAAPTATTPLPFPSGVFTKANLTWEFRADGTYSWRESLSEVATSGVYTVTADQVAIKDDYFPCREMAATYVWAYDGQKLSLTVVEDPCRDRRLSFDRTRWTKKPEP